MMKKFSFVYDTNWWSYYPPSAPDGWLRNFLWSLYCYTLPKERRPLLVNTRRTIGDVSLSTMLEEHRAGK